MTSGTQHKEIIYGDDSAWEECDPDALAPYAELKARCQVCGEFRDPAEIETVVRKYASTINACARCRENIQTGKEQADALLERETVTDADLTFAPEPKRST